MKPADHSITVNSKQLSSQISSGWDPILPQHVSVLIDESARTIDILKHRITDLLVRLLCTLIVSLKRERVKVFVTGGEGTREKLQTTLPLTGLSKSDRKDGVN
jgi:hypothetical protein